MDIRAILNVMGRPCTRCEMKCRAEVAGLLGVRINQIAKEIAPATKPPEHQIMSGHDLY